MRESGRRYMTGGHFCFKIMAVDRYSIGVTESQFFARGRITAGKS